MTTSAKVSITWAELLLVVLLAVSGMGIWIGAEWLEEKAFASAEPQEEDFQTRHHVSDSQRKLTMAEEEWKTTHALLVTQVLDVERQAAKLEVLVQEYPEIQKPSPAAGMVPEEAAKTYREARIQKEAAALLGRHLERRLESLKPRLTQCAADLSKARHAATEEWQAAKARRAQGRLGATLLLAAVGSILLLLATRGALGGSTGQKLGLRLRPVLGAASFFLVILYLYQALGTLSAVLGSIFMLIATGALLRALASSDSRGAAS